MVDAPFYIKKHTTELQKVQRTIAILLSSELAKIFQRFYRRTDEAGVRVRGIGLGLYLCKTYVEAMGGKMWIESHPGDGSSFSFTLRGVETPSSADPSSISEMSPSPMALAITL
ncbi:MAG: ATP-binding protein [Dehalococcoidia bacterium]|nr:ATP-binding protein [Dehalococcoidia bacterium]